MTLINMILMTLINIILMTLINMILMTLINMPLMNLINMTLINSPEHSKRNPVPEKRRALGHGESAKITGPQNKNLPALPCLLKIIRQDHWNKFGLHQTQVDRAATK